MKTEDGTLAVDLSHKILFQVVDGVASIVIKRWGKGGKVTIFFNAIAELDCC